MLLIVKIDVYEKVKLHYCNHSRSSSSQAPRLIVLASAPKLTNGLERVIKRSQIGFTGCCCWMLHRRKEEEIRHGSSQKDPSQY